LVDQSGEHHVLVDNGVQGIAHLVADGGVHERVELRLGLDLVVEDALGDVDDLDGRLGLTFNCIALGFNLDIPIKPC